MSGQQPSAIGARVRELCRLPAENEWVEFNVDQSKPKRIGRGISALANSAALGRQPAAYLVWGVEDGTHAIVGPRFHPSRRKKGGEPLVPWLFQQLSPPIPFQFHEAEVDGKRVVVLQVSPARTQPVAFGGGEIPPHRQPDTAARQIPGARAGALARLRRDSVRGADRG